MIQRDLEKLIQQVLKDLGIVLDKITLEHPGDISHGDYATNVAFQALRKQAIEATKDFKTNIKTTEVVGGVSTKEEVASWGNPKELAEVIAKKILEQKPEFLSSVSVAGPGFINFTLSKKYLSDTIIHIIENPSDWGKTNVYAGKKVMVEYTQPNPFKPFHIGHLMSNAIGESISRLVEFSGAQTVRANYQGDVGLHVAKAIWGIQKRGSPPEGSTISAQAKYIGDCYSYAANLYETNDMVKAEIDIINKKVYDRSDKNINDIYDWGRKVTLNAFEELYTILGTKFDYYFFESEMGDRGKQIIQENIGKVFTESDGAIIFKGEEYDPTLHTRVFVSSLGLPMYEAKELGLTITKFEKENPDISITTTAVEQKEYMRVVTKAVSLLHKEYADKMRHITHGMMRLVGGKMASRKGNVITGESLIQETFEEIRQKVQTLRGENSLKESDIERIGIAALKYSILRSSLESDIVYDEEKSISFEGDSGPYLQYASTRAKSVLEKAEKESLYPGPNISQNDEVTLLERKIYLFPEIVERSATLFEPHHIVTYLTELASVFNSYYAHEQIIHSDNSGTPYRLALVKATYQTIKNGLWLLGISLPEKM